MRAAFCSLCEIADINSVPNFIDFGDEWYEKLNESIEKAGYKLNDEVPFLYNPKLYLLENPTGYCFKGYEKCAKHLSFESLGKYDGVGGYFFASVYSPLLFKYNDWTCHAVIVNKNFQIVHDPNKKNEGIKFYPFAGLIGYNGIRDIWNIEKIK